ENEDPPEPVDDRRHRREQLRQERQGRSERTRRELGEKDRDSERDRRRDQESEKRRVERSPEKRKRAEVSSDRVPGFRPPEIPSELGDRQLGIPDELEGDPRDDQHHEQGEKTRPQAKQPVVGASAAGGRGAHTQSPPRGS